MCEGCPKLLTAEKAEKELDRLLKKDPDGDWSLWDIYYFHESENCHPCEREEWLKLDCERITNDNQDRLGIAPPYKVDGDA